MASSEMIIKIATELVRALEVTMDPTAVHILRQEAYTAYEQFKECSPYAAQVGLYLIESDEARDYTIHFGLQLMEHCIKYRWNQLSQPEKLFIKENAMRLLVAGTQKEPHIKDALSRIIVEMVKREWPQHWPSLLHELNVASGQGTTQAEIVLLIFLRLCEDVALLQTLESSQRRKDLYQALTSNMTDIFAFILHLITMHVELFRSPSPSEQSQAAGRVVLAGLSTLSGFVEWVNLSHITAERNRVLAILCALLQDENFQNHAVECLLQIVARKGSLEDRKCLLDCFDLIAIKQMLAAANEVSCKSVTESTYLFLKKLTQVLTGMGSHFCSLWGKEDASKALNRSEHLDLYLSVMLTFSRHPSLTMVNCANTLWMSFFKHPAISRDPMFQKYIPQWVETTAPKTIRVAYPASRIPTTDQDMAAILDFDSEEEFNAFFIRTRTELLETFRRATDVAPFVTYTYVDKWFRTVLQQSIQEMSSNESSFCTYQSPLFLQWEAMTSLLDKVLQRLVHLDSQVRPSVQSGLELLELCLNFNPLDPLILSVLLSCFSALFVFLSMASAEQSVSLLPRVLDKIFAASVFESQGRSKENRSRAVKNVRRHAGALLVKIAQRYPLLLLPLFDQIHVIIQNLNKVITTFHRRFPDLIEEHVLEMLCRVCADEVCEWDCRRFQTTDLLYKCLEDEDRLSRMERVTLQEALLLICNHLNDYGKQAAFVGEVMRSGSESWLQMDAAFRSQKDLMTFVGLDKEPVEPSTEDVSGLNRSHIVFCTHLFFSVLLRSTWPDDPDRAARGGFVAARTPAGNPIYRSPAAPHIIPVLPSVLTLIKALNGLWIPEVQAVISPGYQSVLQMMELEKANLLGITPPQTSGEEGKSHTPKERMQQFLHIVHENCYHVLGTAGPALGRDFFQIPQLAPAIISHIFTNLDYVPDYRLRPIIRTFLRNFIATCPKVHYEDVLLPVLSVFLPYMLNRLTLKWEYLTQLRNNVVPDEESTDTQEVVEEKLNASITREYTDIIRVCLLGGITASSDSDSMEQDEMDTGTAQRTVNHVFTEAVSELGVLLIRTESTCQVIVLTLLRLLTWNDSSAALKAAGLLHSVIRQLVADNSLNPLIVTHILTNVLQALQIHGHSDCIRSILLTLGAQMYEMLRPKFPCVLEIMMQIPNVNQQDVHRFDEKVQANLANHKTGNKVDKTTREIFRKITNSLVGRNISQLFKKEVKIVDLPQLNPKQKSKLMDTNDFNTDITSLFPESH